MTPSFELMAPLMFAGLIVVLLIGYPVAFSLSAVGLGFGFLAIELGYFDFVLLQALPERILGIVSNQLLLSIPFFTFMGAILERCGLAEDLLDTMGQLFGPIRGGLAYSVILVGALLGAVTGTVAASVIAMGLISLPVMTRYGYDPNGNVLAITRAFATPSQELTTYLYTPTNQVQSRTGADFRATTYDYDDLDRLWHMYAPQPDPGVSGTTTYGYDNVGNVRTIVGPNQQGTNRQIGYQYDPLNRVKQIDYPAVPSSGITIPAESVGRSTALTGSMSYGSRPSAGVFRTVRIVSCVTTTPTSW